MSDWTHKTPTEPGDYWFYGEPYMGSMGMHYEDSYKPDDLYLIRVKIRNISNGMIFIGDGNFMPSNKFNGKQEGHLGYWLKFDLPEIPKDKKGIFKR